MGSELVSDSASPEGDGEPSDPSLAQAHLRIIRESFPYYLSIGMTYQQYWEQDALLVKDYRQGDRMRQERFNNEAWLQGMYIYDAFAVVMKQAFSKHGNRVSYPKEPYTLGATKKKMNEEHKMRKNLAKVESFAERFNARFRSKEKK